MYRFLLFALALASANAALQVGQCGPAVTTACGKVDIVVSIPLTPASFGAASELYVVYDVDFSFWGIKLVSAIEQMYEANCFNDQCGQAATNPLQCTGGVADVWFNTLDVVPPVASPPVRVGEPIPSGQVAAHLYPGDKWVNFDNGSGSFVRFGGSTDKKWGQVVFRVVKSAFGTVAATRSVTLRFHTACDGEDMDKGVYSGYVSAKGLPSPLVGGVNVPQDRSSTLSVASVQALLKREKVESLEIFAAGVFGRTPYLTSATLWKVAASGLKTVVATTAAPSSLLNTPSLNAVQVSVQSGDYFTWTCTYNTAGAAGTVSSGNTWTDNACDIAFVFSNSRCGGASFTPSLTTPADCADPLYTPDDAVAPTEQTHLIYDWHPSGACSDGSQWNGHAYSCTDQYDGGKCAFCVGRANNMESRTCIDRQNMGCNDIFNSKERKTWCNMEFECPASTVSFSVAMILAFIAFLFN